MNFQSSKVHQAIKVNLFQRRVIYMNRSLCMAFAHEVCPLNYGCVIWNTANIPRTVVDRVGCFPFIQVGGNQQCSFTGRLRPEVRPFVFYIPFVTYKVPLSYRKKYPLNCEPYNCSKWHVLWINLPKTKSSYHFHVVLNKLNDPVIRCVCSKYFNLRPFLKCLNDRLPNTFMYHNL